MAIQIDLRMCCTHSSKYSHQQPQLVMMLQMWGMSLGSDSASQVIQWAMGIIFILAVIDFARRFMPFTVALAIGMIVYCASDVVVLSARAVPDLANSLFLFLSFVAFKLWLDTKNDRWLLLVGLLAGFFAAGSRLTGAYGAIALTAFIIIYGLRDKHIAPLVLSNVSMDVKEHTLGISIHQLDFHFRQRVCHATAVLDTRIE